MLLIGLENCRCALILSLLNSTIDDSMMSSDLSIELSQHEEQLSTLSYQKDDVSDEEDEEELPSFLMRTDESKRDHKDN